MFPSLMWRPFTNIYAFYLEFCNVSKISGMPAKQDTIIFRRPGRTMVERSTRHSRKLRRDLRASQWNAVYTILFQHIGLLSVHTQKTTVNDIGQPLVNDLKIMRVRHLYVHRPQKLIRGTITDIKTPSGGFIRLSEMRTHVSQ
jgi:hypothetical protein